MLRLRAGNAEVTALGTLDERRQLLGALRGSLDLSPNAPLQAPESWEPMPSDGGWALLARSANFKNNRVRALAVLGCVVGAFAVLLLVAPHQSTATRFVGAITALVASACGWWSHRFANTETTLRARPGLLVRRSVIHGHEVRDEVLRIEALAVKRAADGDGGDWFRLEVRTADATIRILSQATDADDPVALGRWLEHHTRVPLAV